MDWARARWFVAFTIALLPLFAGRAAAQPGARPAARPPVRGAVPGSTVQLPTLSTFGSSTTVSVPDGGSALLGGNATSSAAQRSGPGNRATSGQAAAGATGVTATIHDMAEMDAQLTAGQAPKDTPQGIAFDPSSAARVPVSVAEAKRLHESEREASTAEAAELLARAEAAEAGGKPAVARIYRRMAARLVNPTAPLKSPARPAPRESAAR